MRFCDGAASDAPFKEKQMQNKILPGAAIAAAAVSLALVGVATPTPAAAHYSACKAYNHCMTHKSHCKTKGHCMAQKAHCRTR